MNDKGSELHHDDVMHCGAGCYFCVRSSTSRFYFLVFIHFFTIRTLIMSLTINDDPVSTPAAEWAEHTTSALGSSANEVSSKPANAFRTSTETGTGSTATTPGVNVPGAFPRSGSSAPSEPMTLPDVSQHVSNARDYISSVDLAQHVDAVRQYLPAREDVQATVASVAQSVGQYLPDGVVDAVCLSILHYCSVVNADLSYSVRFSIGTGARGPGRP